MKTYPGVCKVHELNRWRSISCCKFICRLRLFSRGEGTYIFR
ncbi:hypothetical protein CLOHYLEM_05212 [[Clostridium] hylemonae DSM 15053]|uniref:Uncharacterized protein n=1 Tax=[Clostridium] hylemonae DSM 15053 TaxID=553973 RepID=C0BZH2_9FIRM|nr:hypothetical protein CLOHYLEM_05212 [[Clostridium] hylemonae DSM 15053]